MHGGGTKLGITTHNPPPARLLDLTRLVSRAGRVATGVDRVELAYLIGLLAEIEPVYGLVRSAFGYLLLDREGMQAVLDRWQGRANWGEADRLSRMARTLDGMQRRAQADVRRLAVARCTRHRLRAMLARKLPQGVAYLNVGHTNFTDQVIDALRKGVNARIVVMIHDTIPLDYPQFQRAESVRNFEGLLRRAGASADLVIYNSAQTRADAERWMGAWGRLPEGVVAHLGIDRVEPDATAIPAGLVTDIPYFVTVGTIEPRKNHALLLDIWEEMAAAPPAAMPRLYICGHRGWENEQFLARLDSSGLLNTHVFEVTDLPDPALMALVGGAAGALFPSYAEGFGLPPVEAALLGVPVICGNLPVYKEILGDIPVYAAVQDRYLWRRTIIDLAEDQRAGEKAARQGITRLSRLNWAAHFNVILKLT